MHKIWIVTDQKNKFTPLAQNLSSNDWGKTHWAENVEAAIAAASHSHPDLMVVDESIGGYPVSKSPAGSFWPMHL